MSMTLNGTNGLQFSDGSTFNGIAGMIIAFGHSSAPNGWLPCDGSAVSRTTYASLFTAIGTTWGSGDGTTTFNVPDLRGAFLRGVGTHGTHKDGNNSYFAGPNVGAKQDDQLQGHGHKIGWGTAGGSDGILNTALANATVEQPYNVVRSSQTFQNGTARVGDETRPFNMGVLWCIKY